MPLMPSWNFRDGTPTIDLFDMSLVVLKLKQVEAPGVGEQKPHNLLLHQSSSIS